MNIDKFVFFKDNIVPEIFNRWTALKMCVEHGQGGRNGQQTAIEIMRYVSEFCINTENLSQHDIQELLGDIMDEEFDSICDDNSINEIAICLVKYKQMCVDGKYAEITQELNQLPKCKHWLNLQCKVQIQIDSSSDDDDDDGVSGDDDDDDDDDAMEDDDVKTTKSSKTRASSSSTTSASTAATSSSSHCNDLTSGLSEMEVEEGWQNVPARRRKR